MSKWRKKPVVIDAIVWTGKLIDLEPLGSYDRFVSQELSSDTLQIETLEGIHTANVGDYIIKGVKGELYPCKPDIFRLTYEAVAEVPK